MGRVMMAILFFFLAWGTWASGIDKLHDRPAAGPEELFNQALEKIKNDKPELSILLIREYLTIYPWDGEAWEILRQARILGEFKDPGGQPWWYVSWDNWGPIVLAWAAGFLLVWTAVRIFRSKRHPWLPLPLLILLFPLFLGFPQPQGGQIQTVYHGKKGDGEFYPPAQNALWSPGQEVWVQETKASWARVQVGSVSAWVPEDLVRLF